MCSPLSVPPPSLKPDDCPPPTLTVIPKQVPILESICEKKKSKVTIGVIPEMTHEYPNHKYRGGKPSDGCLGG